MKEKRIFNCSLLFTAALLTIMGQLAYLQLVQGETLASRAQAQHMKWISLYQEERGDILDCFGRSLTGEQQPSLVIFPSLWEKESETLALSFLAQLTGVDKETLTKKIWYPNGAAREPFVLKTALSSAEAEAVVKHNFPGVYSLSLVSRYRQTAIANHVIGFVGKPDETESNLFLKQGEPVPKSVGKAGIEKIYDAVLQGRPSPRLAITIDDKGRRLTGINWQIIPTKERDESANVRLTINGDYQQIAEEALGSQEGAVVILNVQNGDILAAASSPKYDPHMEDPPLSSNAYVNKAFSYYPPASIFKLVLATAALEEGIDLPTDFDCPGYYDMADGRRVKCWYEEGHGKEDLQAAIMNSCNPYFVHLGGMIGGDKIKEYAEKFGLSKQEIIGYPLSPEQTIDFNSYVAGDVANVSIGENGVRLSPVMMAQMMAAIANGGTQVVPRIVQSVERLDGTVQENFPSQTGMRVMSSATAEKLQAYLVATVDQGTAKRINQVAGGAGGKTGTSQYQGVWFAGFSPAAAPQWAIAVYISHGDAGGKEPALVYEQIVNRLYQLEGLDL
ncbi:MAG: hypothetical protein HFI72_06260 [Peptococcaceae bacterium]|nr:hypothetical protein [Peptococcaceae bacterium]